MCDTCMHLKAPVGRFLMAALFLFSAYGKITGFAGSVGFAASVGMPLPEIAIALAIVFELVGAVLLILGWQARIGAGLLVIFTLLATVYFHNPFVKGDELINALKNLAIVGGLLMVVSSGPGAYAMCSSQCGTMSTKEKGTASDDAMSGDMSMDAMK